MRWDGDEGERGDKNAIAGADARAQGGQEESRAAGIQCERKPRADSLGEAPFEIRRQALFRGFAIVAEEPSRLQGVDNALDEGVVHRLRGQDRRCLSGTGPGTRAGYGGWFSGHGVKTFQ